MRLSVVVCTRGRPAQLSACLDRFRALTTPVAWELVVVDNGPGDAAAEVLRRHRGETAHPLTVVEESKPGLGRARNRGWQASSGELVAFTDDDCYPADDYLDRLVECFGDRSLGFVGGRVLLFDPTDYPITIQELDRRVEIAPRAFVPAGLIHGANFAFRRTVLEAIGGFDPGLGAGTPFACEDVDALARAAAAGWRGAYDPRPLVYHHHRRKTRDEALRLRRVYDVARGAYYMKAVLSPALRRRYLGEWLRLIATQRPRRTAGELRGALAYLTRERGAESNE
ncbi:MAG TPA: glycosyltransferase family 2 protein [Gemmatimonadales bacterium]|jgi:GT2 family glycosyltransferase